MKTRQKGCTGCYRYGFNGKEKDTDGEWGSQTHYDYGFRIYNPSIGKFLSVDPLMKSYPMLTPYQFASNSPISGIDIDGLEYVHYYVFLNKYDAVVAKVLVEDFRNMSAEKNESIHGMSDKEFYSKYSESFGLRGRGAQYTYFREVDDGYYRDYQMKAMEMHQNGPVSRLTINGHYTGRGSVTYKGAGFKNGGSPSNPYDFSLPPVNIIDHFALEHDKSQSIVDGHFGYSLDGYLGPLEDVRDQVFDGDKHLLSQFRSIKEGQIDPITKKEISREALITAANGEVLFSMIVEYKSWKRGKLLNSPELSAEDITIDDWRDSGSEKEYYKASILKYGFSEDE